MGKEKATIWILLLIIISLLMMWGITNNNYIKEINQLEITQYPLNKLCVAETCRNIYFNDNFTIIYDYDTVRFNNKEYHLMVLAEYDKTTGLLGIDYGFQEFTLAGQFSNATNGDIDND